MSVYNKIVFYYLNLHPAHYTIYKQQLTLLESSIIFLFHFNSLNIKIVIYHPNRMTSEEEIILKQFTSRMNFFN